MLKYVAAAYRGDKAVWYSLPQNTWQEAAFEVFDTFSKSRACAVYKLSRGPYGSGISDSGEPIFCLRKQIIPQLPTLRIGAARPETMLGRSIDSERQKLTCVFDAVTDIALKRGVLLLSDQLMPWARLQRTNRLIPEAAALCRVWERLQDLRAESIMRFGPDFNAARHHTPPKPRKPREAA